MPNTPNHDLPYPELDEPSNVPEDLAALALAADEAIAAAFDAMVLRTEMGADDGVATLDGDGLVPVDQIPVAALPFGGGAELTIAERTTDYNGAGPILATVGLVFDGATEVWLELWAAALAANALSIAGGGSNMTPTLRQRVDSSGALVASYPFRALPPANPTDGGNTMVWTPYSARVKVTPTAGTRRFELDLVGGGSLFATGVQKAFLRVANAA